MDEELIYLSLDFVIFMLCNKLLYFYNKNNHLFVLSYLLTYKIDAFFLSAFIISQDESIPLVSLVSN